MNINNLISFEVVKDKSKKNNDYYAIVLHIGEVKTFLKFITENEYNTIVKSIKKGE